MLAAEIETVQANETGWTRSQNSGLHVRTPTLTHGHTTSHRWSASQNRQADGAVTPRYRPITGAGVMAQRPPTGAHLCLCTLVATLAITLPPCNKQYNTIQFITPGPCNKQPVDKLTMSSRLSLPGCRARTDIPYLSLPSDDIL
jgi:hypothetical protein